MNINKKTYKILNLVIVVLFIIFSIIYVIITKEIASKKKNITNKTYSIQKSVDGYLLEIEGLFFELRKENTEYFRGASNPMTGFMALKKDVWLDFILSAIQDNYNNKEECYFEPSTNTNTINIYKIKIGDQKEISPSINIQMRYYNDQQIKIDKCIIFIENLINKVNSKIRNVIQNEINGHDYHSYIKGIERREIIKNEGIKDYKSIIPIIKALIAEEINVKKKMYENINAFEIKERKFDKNLFKVNHYLPIIFSFIITIILIIVLNILYRSKINILSIFK